MPKVSHDCMCGSPHLGTAMMVSAPEWPWSGWIHGWSKLWDGLDQYGQLAGVTDGPSRITSSLTTDEESRALGLYSLVSSGCNGYDERQHSNVTAAGPHWLQDKSRNPSLSELCSIVSRCQLRPVIRMLCACCLSFCERLKIRERQGFTCGRVQQTVVWA